MRRGWKTIEYDGVRVDIPATWERWDMGSCEFTFERWDRQGCLSVPPTLRVSPSTTTRPSTPHIDRA